MDQINSLKAYHPNHPSEYCFESRLNNHDYSIIYYGDCFQPMISGLALSADWGSWAEEKGQIFLTLLGTSFACFEKAT